MNNMSCVLTPLYGKFEPQLGVALGGKFRPELSYDGDPLSDMNTIIVFCSIFLSFRASTTRPTDSSSLDTIAARQAITIGTYIFVRRCCFKVEKHKKNNIKLNII